MWKEDGCPAQVDGERRFFPHDSPAEELIWKMKCLVWSRRSGGHSCTLYCKFPSELVIVMRLGQYFSTLGTFRWVDSNSLNSGS